MTRMNNAPVSAGVLDAAINWQLCFDTGSGNAQERAEFERWHAASEEHARAWRQLGMLDQPSKMRRLHEIERRVALQEADQPLHVLHDSGFTGLVERVHFAHQRHRLGVSCSETELLLLLPWSADRQQVPIGRKSRAPTKCRLQAL